MDVIEEWVWFYHNEGFSIIPLGVNNAVEDREKKPSLDTWDKYKTTPATREELQQWLDQGLFKGIGVICGHVSNDLVVLDIDDASIPELIGLNLDKIAQSGSWVVKTGKGYHIYNRHHSNPGGVLKPSKYKIEFRANNGYCVAPPSPHPNGKTYQFMNILKPEDLKPLASKDVAAIFQEMKDKIGKAWNIQPSKTHAIKGTAATAKTSGYPRCVEIALQTRTEHPSRHNTIYGIASSFAMQGIPQDMALKRIKQFNLEYCIPPKTNAEVENAVNSCYKEGSKKYGCEFWMDDAELCPYENIMECPYGRKKARRELAKQHRIFEYQERKNKETGDTFVIPIRVIPPRLATLILNEYPYNFKTTRDTQEIYYYNGGTYHQNGETIIASIAEEHMEDLSSIHNKNEVISHIKDKHYITREQFNAPVNYINLKNGIYNLDTNELTCHDPDTLFLNEIPVAYDPGAECPRILKFISEIIYPEDIPTIQEFFGYCLYRRHHIHKSCMLIGEGKNGKSTLINLLSTFLGQDNVASRELNQLIADKFAVADLYGKLANVAADIASSALGQTGLFKALTGEDLVTAEKKFKGAFNFRNYAKFIFSANALPRSPDKTYAFYRRWIIINFPNTFTDLECNENLIQELTTPEELSGLFNWAIIGLQRLIRQGDFSYGKSVEEVAEQYELLSDPMYAFVKEFIRPQPGGAILKDDLYEKYVNWARQKKLSIIPKNMLTKDLSKHIPEIRSGTLGGKGGQKPAYREIAWMTDSDPSESHKDGMVQGVAENDSLDRYGGYGGFLSK